MKPADQIKHDLMSFARGHSYDIILPNFFFGRYEMDIFKLSHAGYVTEYEIKVSRADFKKDFQKGRSARSWAGIPAENKHDVLQMGKAKCNRFFFVVPKDLVKVDEVPKHAGLIYWDGNMYMDIVKNAPLLHKEKQGPNIFPELARSLSFREQHARQNASFYRHQLDLASQKNENLLKYIQELENQQK